MHILTDTVKDNNSRIDRITYNRQHAGNKRITYRYSGNGIERKYHQNVMEKGKNCAAGKTNILKSEPNIKKHADCCNNHSYDCILTHLFTYCRGNALCGNSILIHSKFFNQGIL